MATEWTYRDRLCNVSCSMYGSEPAEIQKLTRALNVIVKDLGETSLYDPLLWQMLRGRNFTDRMIESAVRHVEDGIRMKCISRANELKEKERKERERREEQARMEREKAQHDASVDAARYAVEGLQFGVDWAMQPGTTEYVVVKMKSLGHDKFKRRDESPREMARVIELIKEKLRSVVKDLGTEALDDPALVRAFRDQGADSDDYLEAVRQVKREREVKSMFESLQSNMRLVASTKNPWEYARKHPMSNGDMLFDTESQKTLMWSNGVLEELSNEPSPEVKRQFEQIEAVIGTMEGASAEEITKKLHEMVDGDPSFTAVRKDLNGETVKERLAGMGVTFTSPDESVNLLAERLENENPKKDEERWRKKRIVKEAGHFENLRNTKYGQDGKKGSLWSRIKSAIYGR